MKKSADKKRLLHVFLDSICKNATYTLNSQ